MRCAHSPFRPVLLLVASVFFIHATLRAQEPSEKAVIANMGALKFVTFPNLPDCFTGAVVKGDPNQGASVFLIKGSAGCGVPWHWHTPNEEVMMVTGTARLQMKEEKPIALRPGGYSFIPAHHVHRFHCSTACTAFVHSDGAFDIHYVDEAGKEISSPEALRTRISSRPARKE